MGLTDLISATEQKPYAMVRIGGSPIYDVLSVEWDRAFDQNSGTLRIYTPTHYQFDPGAVYTVEVFEGYNGYTARTFTGYVDDIDDERFPDKYCIVCRDVLKKAIDTWLDDEGKTYTNTQAETAVADLLAYAGLGVNAGATNFTIGDVEPAKMKLISVMDGVLQIASLIGWHVWATKDGTVQFQYKKPLPGAASFWSYTEGQNILKYKYTKTDRNLRNRVVVIGYNEIKSVAQAGSPYVPSPPTYRTAILASEFIDTSNMARAIAGWMVGDLNHLTESIEMDVIGNPLLDVGHTVAVSIPSKGVSGNFFVFGIRSRMDGETGEYVMSLTLVGGNSSPFDYDDGEEQNPIASFTYQQVLWGDPTPVIYFDASSSSCPDSTITNYAWDFGDSSGSPLNSQPLATHKYDYATFYMQPVTVTLTVTAANGKTATCSKTIVVGDTTDEGFAYATVYAGGVNCLYTSLDSGLTWNRITVIGTVQCISANVTKMAGSVIAGTTSGYLYKVARTGTSATVVENFGFAIRSVYVDQTDDAHWIVGLSNGYLHETLDKGATWTLRQTFSEGLTRTTFCNPASPNEWWSPSVTTVRQSLDGGSEFTDKLTVTDAIMSLAWHFGQYISVAMNASGAVKLSFDNGITWVDATGISFVPSATSGGAHAPLDFAVSSADANYIYVTIDGATWISGGGYLTLSGANDVLYSWKFWQTLLAGG